MLAPRCVLASAFYVGGGVAVQRVLESTGFNRDGLLRSFLCFGDRRTDALVFSRIAGEA